MYIYTAKGYPFFLFATFVTFQSKVNQISNKEEKKNSAKKRCCSTRVLYINFHLIWMFFYNLHDQEISL